MPQPTTVSILHTVTYAGSGTDCDPGRESKRVARPDQYTAMKRGSTEDPVRRNLIWHWGRRKWKKAWHVPEVIFFFFFFGFWFFPFQ